MTRACMCGCGELVLARFVNGHDGQLAHRLYRAALSGHQVIIYDVAYRPDTYAAKVGPVFAGYFHQLVTEGRT